MNTDKLQQLLKDEKFCEQLLNLETSEQVQGLLKENGVELSIVDIDKAKDLIERMQSGNLTDQEKKVVELCQNQTSDELNEEELEAVAGGIIDPFTFTLILFTVAAVVNGGIFTHVLTRRRW